jgi:hypothetical protein
VFVKPELPMQHKLLHETNGQRTFAVVLQTGEEVMASLQKFVAGQNISDAQRDWRIQRPRPHVFRLGREELFATAGKRAGGGCFDAVTWRRGLPANPHRTFI